MHLFMGIGSKFMNSLDLDSMLYGVYNRTHILKVEGFLAFLICYQPIDFYIDFWMLKGSMLLSFRYT